jgi:alginate O-acetyltransferase complex protein AlgI
MSSLPVTYFVFLKLTSKKQRYVWLTVSGCVFQSFWNYKFCLFMAVFTTVSYFAGLGFPRLENSASTSALHCIAGGDRFELVVVCLQVCQHRNVLGERSGERTIIALHATTPQLDILLPVGISFYTFHTITFDHLYPGRLSRHNCTNPQFL